MATDYQGASKRHCFLPTVEEASPARYCSGTTFITDVPPVSPTETPWGVDRENYRGIVESGQDHLILVYKANMWALTNLVSSNA